MPILACVAVPDAYALEPNAGERLVFGGVTILVRAAAVQTGGAFTLFEEVPPMGDTPLHVHEREDELFYVLEGEHVFRSASRSTASGRAALCSARGASPMPSAEWSPARAVCSF